MQKALNRVCLIHGPYPRAKACIGQSIAESANGIHDNQCRVRRVRCQNRVRDDVAERCHDGDAALAKFDVDARIRKRSDRVSEERC